jgi:isopentenyl diphosphate isomerase/L-lactate dehydrogenase-like FMN-dependent dehydrogenase
MGELLINLDDYAKAAGERIEPGALAFLDGGASDEITLRENEESWRRYRLRPRVMRDVSSVELTTVLLGEKSRMPVGVAPTAQHGLFAPGAELTTARAAAAAGVPFVASTMSTLALEEIAEAGGTLWFQLYIQRDHTLTESLVRRAEAAGYVALVLTVDRPVLGQRERDLRVGAGGPIHTHGNLGLVLSADDFRHDPVLVDASLTWEVVDWLRTFSRLPVVVKGVLTGEDAALAVEHGAAAVWVSNHGGRQLDRVSAPIDVLEEIVGAVGGRAEVYVDGGVRRGVDVAIGLALGAKAVFLGRPIVHGLAVDGEAGARDVLAIMERELVNAMALLGAPSVTDVVREMVV